MKHICFGNYDSGLCTFYPINHNQDFLNISVRKLFPLSHQDHLYVCSTHWFLHYCSSLSTECIVETYDVFTNEGQCQISKTVNKYVKIPDSKNQLNSFYKGSATKKAYFKNKQSLKQLINQNINLKDYGIPNPVEYHSIISNFIGTKQLDISSNRTIFESAINRTYEFFLNQSTLNLWQDHIQIICACFYELFSKSSHLIDEFGTSEFKTRIKFIISMEMSGKVKLAEPLYSEAKYVQKRRLKLSQWEQQENKKKKKWKVST